MLVGELPDPMPVGIEHTAQYFRERYINLDCRGPLFISRESFWAFYITVITESHEFAPEGHLAVNIAFRPTHVERLAWIGSGAILYNCIIGEGAIVSVGTVVRTQEVKPWTMVAGNPARVIARFVDGKWRYAKPKWEVLE